MACKRVDIMGFAEKSSLSFVICVSFGIFYVRYFLEVLIAETHLYFNDENGQDDRPESRRTWWLSLVINAYCIL